MPTGNRNTTISPAPSRTAPGYAYAPRAQIVRDRPSARGVLLLVAPFVLVVSLIPSSHGIMFRMPPLPPVWWTVNLMLVFAVIVVPFRWLAGSSHPVFRSTKRWFLTPILLLGLWQVVSLTWNGRDGFMRWYSFVQTLGMCAAVLSGVVLSSGLPHVTRLRIGRGLTLLVAFVVAVYMGLSFVFPGWRPSSALIDWTTASLGFIRVFGPLGTATTLNFVLVPAMGFSLGMIFLPGAARAFWGLVTLLFFVAIIGTGSRGGVVSLGMFVILLVVSLRLRAMVFVLPLAVFLGGVVSLTGIPERFLNFHAPARVETYATAWRTLTSTPRNVTVGAGHGALYSALHDLTLRRLHRRSRWYLLSERTAFGYTLRSSHTALLRTLVETGMVGFALLLTPLLWMLFRLLVPCFRGLRNPPGIHAVCTLTGCVAVIPYMAADEFFVGAFWIVFLWTMFVVIGAEGRAEIVRSQSTGAAPGVLR